MVAHEPAYVDARAVDDGDDRRGRSALAVDARRDADHGRVRGARGRYRRRSAGARTRSRCPDLYLLDLSLPGIDGLEVLARLRSTTTVPVVVLTVREAKAGQDRGARPRRRRLRREAHRRRRAHRADPGGTAPTPGPPRPLVSFGRVTSSSIGLHDEVRRGTAGPSHRHRARAAGNPRERRRWLGHPCARGREPAESSGRRRSACVADTCRAAAEEARGRRGGPAPGRHPHRARISLDRW